MRVQIVTGHHIDSKSKYSWKAPTNEDFDKGDMIVVNTSQGMQLAIVDAFMSVDNNTEKETLDFIETMTGKPIKQLKNVVGKVEPMEIEEEEEECPWEK